MLKLNRFLQLSLSFSAAMAGVLSAGVHPARADGDGGNSGNSYQDIPQFVKRTSADRCQRADVRDLRPALGNFLHVPRNQRDIGWCYSFAAADLISHKLGRPVSAVDVAISYNYEIEQDAFSRFFRRNFRGETGQYEGGMIGKAARYAQRYGACSEADIPSTRGYYSNTLKTDFAAMQACLSAQSQDESLRGRMASIRLSSSNGASVSCGETARSLFPRLNPSQAFQMATGEDATNLNKMLFKQAQAACTSGRMRIPENLRAVEHGGPGTPGYTLFEEMDAQLSAGNPVGVSYLPLSLMANSDQYGFFRRLTSGHASVVVAREFRGGECKYLVRNSWGASCDYYKDSLRRDCIPQEGAFWISEEELNPVLFSVTYFE